MCERLMKLPAVGLLALLFIACGGASGPPLPGAPGSTDRPLPGTTTPPGEETGSIDACTVLSDEEMKAATGQAVIERRASTLTRVFPSVCDIQLDGGGSLTVSVKASGGREMFECCFEPLIGENNLDEEAVSGLGDKAIRGGDTLMVLKDDVLFDVHYIEVGRQDRAAVVRYLAEAVLARLACLADGCPDLTPAPPPPTAQATDSCALLTPEQLEQATGYGALSSEPAFGMGFAPGCRWTLDTDFPGAHYIQVTIKETGGRAQFDFLANDMFETPPEHVPGIGDDAIKTASIPGGAFHAVVGDRLITLEFFLPLSVDDPYALVAPLVEVALSRLR